jgi:hypothetical protein
MGELLPRLMLRRHERHDCMDLLAGGALRTGGKNAVERPMKLPISTMAPVPSP